MCSVMAPWIPPIVEFLQTIAPIASVVTSIVLAYLYFTQSQTLDEQRKLSKMEQCPYVTGPFDFGYDPNKDRLEMHLSNIGDGVAQSVRVRTNLGLKPDNTDSIKQGWTTNRFSRADTPGQTNNEIHPGEQSVRYVIDIDDFSVSLEDDSSHEGYRRSPSLGKVMAGLCHENVEFIGFKFDVVYEDLFGEDENPFGQEYSSLLSIVFDSNEGIYDTKSLFESFCEIRNIEGYR